MFLYDLVTILVLNDRLFISPVSVELTRVVGDRLTTDCNPNCASLRMLETKFVQLGHVLGLVLIEIYTLLANTLCFNNKPLLDRALGPKS